VNGLGNVVARTQGYSDPCPVGQREFAPIQDVHVGVLSTSLGGHGADTCSPASFFWDPTQNDAAHLVTRGPGGTSVPTWQGMGFLAWDPLQKVVPPGEGDAAALAQDIADLALGAGENGCGFEATLESVYRFLVDPEPYASIELIAGLATPTGVDTALLHQRSEFLRPDSALVVVLITDEDDCSVREEGQYYLVLQALEPGNPSAAFHLPRPRAECAQNPDDPCCASCGEPTPQGCPPEPGCSQGPLSDAEDPFNLRCFDQKRRFGVDFLYPVQRYIDGLTKPTVVTRDGGAAPNPIYAAGRSPELVMVAGILGVPWQDVAKAPTSLTIGYSPAREIDWSLLLGDGGAPPGDPLMIKSIAPRTGTNPPTGKALAPPGSPPLANPINGHERVVPQGDDLQYACIYARPSPVTCMMSPCGCVAPDIDDNPICQDPDGGAYGSVERFARALPSTRPLGVLSALGDRATIASVCAPETSSTAAPTYAYKPAIDAILRTLRPRVRP
jgi:hypothetical protein